jgi:predicted  nucleic acid-binding Zn-ribbon protein
MSASTFFKVSFNKVICQESLVTLQRQIEEKKAHLVVAKTTYEEAASLRAAEEQKIVTAENGLALLNEKLQKSKNPRVVDQLQTKIKLFEAYIASNRPLIQPLIESHEKLAKDIQTLEDEIHALEQSVNSVHTPSP